MSSELPAAARRESRSRREELPSFLREARERARARLRASPTDLPDPVAPEIELDRVTRFVFTAIRSGAMRPVPDGGSLLGVRVLELLRSEVVRHWPPGAEAGSSELPPLLGVVRAFEDVRRALWPEDPDLLGAPVLDPWSRELLAEVAHTLGSSFSSIVFLAEVLLAAQDGEVHDARTTQLRLLQSAALTVGSTAGDLLRLSGPIAEPPASPGETSTVGEAVEAVAAAVRPGLEAKELELRIELPAPDVRIARAFTLRRILLSLALAAARWAEAGSVVLRCERAGRGGLLCAVEVKGGAGTDKGAPLTDVFPKRSGGEGWDFSSAGAGIAGARRLLGLLGSDLRVEARGEDLRLWFLFPISGEGGADGSGRGSGRALGRRG
jgi:hypothetical protein